MDDVRLKALNERLEAALPVSADGAMKISAEFRGILDKAEELAGDAKVEPEHLIRAAWPTIKDELAPYFRPRPSPPSPCRPRDSFLPDCQAARGRRATRSASSSASARN